MTDPTRYYIVFKDSNIKWVVGTDDYDLFEIRKIDLSNNHHTTIFNLSRTEFIDQFKNSLNLQVYDKIHKFMMNIKPRHKNVSQLDEMTRYRICFAYSGVYLCNTISCVYNNDGKCKTGPIYIDSDGDCSNKTIEHYETSDS